MVATKTVLGKGTYILTIIIVLSNFMDSKRVTLYLIFW